MKDLEILSNLFEPIALIDKDLKIINYNNYFATFTKSSPRILKKIQNIAELIITENNLIKNLIEKSHKEQSVVVSEEIPISISTDEDVSYTIVFKIIPHEENFLFCINDVSNEKQLYDKYRLQVEELKKSHNQIIQSDKLTTLGELSAGISHEINNPLTIACGNAQNIEFFAEEDFAGNKEIISTSNKRVLESLEKISSIIANMKSYVHDGDESDQEYCNIVDIVNKAKELVYTGKLKEKVDFEVTEPPNNIICLVNKIEIEQVFVNVLKNAFDAIKEKGSDFKGKVSVNISQNEEDRSTEIEFCDNGIGIAGDIEEIFNPFYTTKNIGKGTGLGLSISRKLIEKYNGEIQVEKTDEKGTIVKVSLPVIEMSSIGLSSNFIGNLSENEQKIILVVDDEAEILNVMDQFIKDQGHTFIGSTGGEDALSILIQLDVDLIITDYFIKEMEGTEFVKKVREFDEDVPIVYMSSSEQIKKFKEDKDKLNVAGFISKPFSKDGVLKIIEEVFKNKEDKDASGK